MAFLGDKKSELLDKLSEDQKTRLKNLLQESSPASTSTAPSEEVDPNKLQLFWLV